MSEEMIAHTIANIGVPTALCFYTLFKVNQTLEKLTEAVRSLENEMRNRK